MTIDELIEIIKTGEQMDLADSRLAFGLAFAKRAPIGLQPAELRGLIEDRIHRDYPEQFDDLNHADGGSEDNALAVIEILMAAIRGVFDDCLPHVKERLGAAYKTAEIHLDAQRGKL